MDATNSHSLYLVSHVRGSIAMKRCSLRSENKFFELPRQVSLNAALFSRKFYLAGILDRVHRDIYTT